MKLNDRVLVRSSHEDVSVALLSVSRKHRKMAQRDGIEFLDFLLRHHDRVAAMRQEMEETCILMGWTMEEHVRFEHEEIMKELRSQQ
jgi:hypothetical protein